MKWRAGVLTLLLATGAQAAEHKVASIEIFTVEADKPRLARLAASAKGAVIRVYHVDKVSNIQQQLTDRLPRDIPVDQIQQAAREQFANGEWNEPLQQMRSGFDGLLAASQYSIDRVPAYVFDQKYVVYGGEAVAALTRYRRYLERDNR